MGGVGQKFWSLPLPLLLAAVFGRGWLVPAVVNVCTTTGVAATLADIFHPHLPHAALMEGQDTMSLVAQLGPTALKTIGGLGIVLLGGRLLMRRCECGGAGGLVACLMLERAMPCRLGRFCLQCRRPAGAPPTILFYPPNERCSLSAPPHPTPCSVFELVAEAKSEETFVALCLLTVTGASLLTQRMGFSDTLGAFVAGVLLSGEVPSTARRVLARGMGQRSCASVPLCT